jgi:ribosomal protein L21
MYKGNTYSGEHLPIKAHFKRENGQIEGTIHIQGATLPLQKIKVMKNDSVYFQMTQTTKNGNVIAKFNCHFKKKSLITGKIHQLGRTFSIKLNRYKPKSKPDHHKNNLKEISGTFTALAYQNKSLGEYNQRQHSR